MMAKVFGFAQNDCQKEPFVGGPQNYLRSMLGNFKHCSGTAIPSWLNFPIHGDKFSEINYSHQYNNSFIFRANLSAPVRLDFTPEQIDCLIDRLNRK
jgi:hypothetical protein